MPDIYDNVPNLYDLISDNSDSNDLSSQLLNQIFENLDKEDVSKYHSINSYNSLQKENINCLTFLHINMRSIVKKMDCLDAFICSLEKKT